MGYARPVGPGFSPLDEELALLPGDLSPTVAEGVTRLGTWMPFGPAARLLGFFWGVAVSESSVRRQTESAGAAYVAVQAAERERVDREGAEPPPGPPIQQLSLDGAMVPLVGGEWAEVKTAVIGTVTTRRGPEGPEVHTEHPSYFSRLADAATFTQEVGIELFTRGTASAGTVVAVSDGAEWIQGVVDTYRRDAIRILDFPHAVEHLTGASQAIWGVGSAAARTWVTTHAHTLKHDDPEDVLAALRDLPVAEATDPVAAAAVQEAALRYLTTRREHIQYATFQAQGYPIGSGAVESANKLTVEARMKGSGMHWARCHVNPLLALRTVACAERWASAWPLICQELRRRRQAHRQAPVQATHPAAPPTPLSAAAVKSVVGRKPARPTTLHQPPRQHPPMVVHGTPTANHPWRQAAHDAARANAAKQAG